MVLEGLVPQRWLVHAALVLDDPALLRTLRKSVWAQVCVALCGVMSTCSLRMAQLF